MKGKLFIFMGAWLCFKMGKKTRKETKSAGGLGGFKQISCIPPPTNLMDYDKNQLSAPLSACLNKGLRDTVLGKSAVL